MIIIFDNNQVDGSDETSQDSITIRGQAGEQIVRKVKAFNDKDNTMKGIRHHQNG